MWGHSACTNLRALYLALASSNAVTGVNPNGVNPNAVTGADPNAVTGAELEMIQWMKNSQNDLQIV